MEVLELRGNSLHICESLEQCFINKEVNVKIESIQQHFNKKDIKNMEEDLKNTDVIGLVAPLYVDALPYPVIAFLEEIEERFGKILKNKEFFVIVQCNFPQSFRNDPVVLSCECFAKELDMKFLGGLNTLFARPFIVVGNIAFKQAKKKYMKSN